MASPRQLAFRDRFVWELEQVVSAVFDDCDGLTDPYIFPDMTTRVPFVLYLSQEQFTMLYSAVLSGADLTYPLQSHDVEYLFLQAVNCTMSELCQAIADCILNSENTQEALNQFLSDAGLTGGVGDPNQPVGEGVSGGNLLPAGYTCTDDKAFGMSLAVVDAIHDATTEVLQAIEILTNPVEIAAELGDNVPGIGALATAGDIARWIQDSAKEAYDLAWSTTVRDELACLLWCEWKASCLLSFDTIWGIYLDTAGAPPPPGVLLTDWLAWLIALPFTASLSTVATISLMGLLAMRYGGSFGDFELGIRSMGTVINLAQDESSSDWSTVCSACVGAWCYFFDFVLAQGGWTTMASHGRNFGIWSSGIGWQSVWGSVGGDWDERLYVHRFFTTSDATFVEVKFTAVGTVGINRGLWITVRLGGVGQASILDQTWLADGTVQTVALVFSESIDEIDVVLTGDAPSDGSLEIVLRSVEVHGTGPNPFGLDNC